MIQENIECGPFKRLACRIHVVFQWPCRYAGMLMHINLHSIISTSDYHLNVKQPVFHVAQ